MPRNLDRRIEVIVPVEDSGIRKHLLHDLLEVLLKDNCQAWDLHSNGAYIRRAPAENKPAFSAQIALLKAHANA